jgi:hypothetical protein
MAQHEAPSAPPIPAAPAPAGGQDRFLLAIVGGTILLVIVSVVLVLVFGRGRQSAPVDPNGPAGVVHGYIEAVRAGDADKARMFLSRKAQTDFDTRIKTNPIHPTSDEHLRIVVETTKTTDTTAEVKVTLSHFYARSDPFSSSTSHRDVTTRLIREDGAWKINDPPYTYELY